MHLLTREPVIHSYLSRCCAMDDAPLNQAVGSRFEVVLEVQIHARVTPLDHGTLKDSTIGLPICLLRWAGPHQIPVLLVHRPHHVLRRVGSEELFPVRVQVVPDSHRLDSRELLCRPPLQRRRLQLRKLAPGSGSLGGSIRFH